jgi:hypothetical protein
MPVGAESSLARPLDRCRFFAVEDHSQEWCVAPSEGRDRDATVCDARSALFTVIFARRHDARREEDGPAALAGAITGVRDGGDRPGGWCEVTARRHRPAPVRGSARGSGSGCRPHSGETPATSAANGAAPSNRSCTPWRMHAPCSEPGRGRRPACPEGVPLKLLLVECRASAFRAEQALSAVRLFSRGDVTVPAAAVDRCCCCHCCCRTPALPGLTGWPSARLPAPVPAVSGVACCQEKRYQ